MSSISTLDTRAITERFTFDKFTSQALALAENLSYSLQLHVLRRRPCSMDSIKALTIRRSWVDFGDNIFSSSWKSAGRDTKLTKKHFQPVTFSVPKQDVGRSLSLICLLALKVMNDRVRNQATSGLLFRSDMFVLRHLGIWRGDVELDRLASDIVRSSRSISSVSRRYKKMPLVHEFLLDGNEIHNLVCWAGSNQKDTRCQYFSEKVWCLNAKDTDIEVIDETGARWSDERLPELFEAIFPADAVMTTDLFHHYRRSLRNNRELSFHISNLPSANAVGAKSRPRATREIEYGYLVYRRTVLQGHRIDFSSHFQRHLNDTVIVREQVLRRLNKLIHSTGSAHSFILLLGNLGIGKTTVVLEYLLRSKKNYAHYFFDSESPELNDPTVLLKHLYVTIASKYKIAITEVPESDDYLLSDMNALLSDIANKVTAKTGREVIFLDGMEQAVLDTTRIMTVLQALNSLVIPQQVVFVLSSAYMPALSNLIAPDWSNVILIDQSDDDLLTDIRSYLQERLRGGNRPDEYALVASQCEGSFLYARYLVDTLVREDRSIWRTNSTQLPELKSYYDSLLASVVDNATDSRCIELLLLAHSRRDQKYPLGDLSLLMEVLDVEDEAKDMILNPITQYVDLKQYVTHDRIVGFHESFANYLMSVDAYPEYSCAGYTKLIAYLDKYINDGRILDIPEPLLRYYPLFHDNISDTNAVLEKIRKTIIPFFFEREGINICYLSPGFVFYCCHLAELKTLPEHIMFFYMLNAAKGHYCSPHFQQNYFADGFRGEPYEQAMRSLRKKIGALKNPKSVYVNTMRALLAGDICGFDVEPLLYHGFFLMIDRFKNNSDIIRLCNKYTKAWMADIQRS